jgi:predicted hydrocarbon binding protein
MTNPNDLIAILDLERFFSHDSNRYDLAAGTAHNAAGSRVIYLSTDVVKGIHQALVDEAGPAWRLILKNCGTLWGRRVARHLDHELGLMFNTTPADLPVAEYLKLVEGYFSAHGWGLLALDLSKAESHGVITATLENSLFSEVLDQETSRVDFLIAGVLRTLFTHIAGQDLDCQEIASTRGGAPRGLFAITAAARLDALESRIEKGEPAHTLLASLCQAA